MQTRIASTTSSKTLFVDVMKDDRFIFTLRYRYCPLFKIDLKDIYEKVLEKRPALRNERIKLCIG